MKRPFNINRQNAVNSITAKRWREFVVLVAACLAFGYVSSSCSKPENKVEIAQTETAPAATPEFSAVPVINPNADFSKFQHSNAQHARFPCALCHERTDNSATPKLSGHLPCAGCHTAQFADNKNSVCTICHTDAASGAMKAFPALKSFNVRFDHAKHQRQTDCATCHKSSRSAGALSIPTGLIAHNSCFQCHSANAEQNLSSCGACHQPGQKTDARSETAKIFGVFSHDKHRLDCATCHTVKAGAARGKQVSSPLAAMHFAPKNSLSCGGCHNNQKTFGGTDFADCKRCHRGNNFQF